jgi:DNA-binding transcriptional LysR family regulator
MHVTLRHLRAAVAVARNGSFRRAAEAVHLSQPALSLAISELEGALGVSLFDRTSRSVAPTDIGAAFVQGAARVLADFDQLVQEVGDIAQSRRGRVVVSCVSSLAGRVMPRAIQACAQRYPQIEVVVQDDVAQQVLQAVHAREADFAMTTEPLVMGADVVFDAMQQDPFYIVCERTHRFARRRQVRWSELHGEPLIMLSTTSGSFQVVHDELVRQGIRPQRSTPVSHLSTVHGMLESGFGISALPKIALPVADHPTLVARPLVAPRLARTVGAYRRRDRALSPAAQTFLEVMREVLTDAPAMP